MPKTKFENVKQIERDLRRKVILEAALELFAVKDFRSVTVREIAKNAGISIGTIYNYYPTLTELLLDVFLNSAMEINSLMDNLNGNKPLGILTLCEFYITYLNDNMTFYQMMSHFMLGGEFSPDGTEKLDGTMKQMLDRFEATLICEGIGKDSRLTAHALFSALNGIMISYARYPGKSDEAVRKHTLRLAKIIAGVFS